MKLIWKPWHLKHRHLTVLFWVLLLLPWLLTPQACVTQPCNQNTCVLCCSILSHRDSCEKCSARGRLSSITFLPSSVSNKQQRAANGTRISALQGLKRITGMTWFSLHLTTPETLFEGVSPPTVVFLLMTHKIPHESDTICLIKPAAKMKLYVWCSNKQGIDKKNPKHKTN